MVALVCMYGKLGRVCMADRVCMYVEYGVYAWSIRCVCRVSRACM